MKIKTSELTGATLDWPVAWARPDAVDASQDFRFIKIDDFTVPLYAPPPSAVPVVEQLVLAATAVIDYDESDPDDGVTMILNYADALAKCRDAIATGQKFIKESGK